MAQIISGKEVAAQVKARIAAETAALAQQGVVPGLAVVIVGENPASKIYVRNKEKACAEVGFYSELHALPEQTTEEARLALVRQLNTDATLQGILVQLPLPAHLDAQQVIETISPDKDVDAFHPVNVGGLVTGTNRFAPCTPAGIMELLHSAGISVSGKRCVVIGRSNIVGKPMALLLLRENGTVTICHSHTRQLAEICREADILVAAVGRPHFVTAEMVKPGAAVIDVGMDRDAAGKLCGDVDFAAVEPVAGYITPVPGGVGPMTIAMLMQNTLTAARRLSGIEVGK